MRVGVLIDSEESWSVMIDHNTTRSMAILVMFKIIMVLWQFATIFLFVGQSYGSRNSTGIEIVTVWLGFKSAFTILSVIHIYWRFPSESL